MIVGKKLGQIIWERNNKITTDYIGLRIAIYNGKQFFSILIREEMVGYKFSEFIRTKIIGSQIHKKKIKKNKK